jgi:hypothetical protein
MPMNTALRLRTIMRQALETGPEVEDLAVLNREVASLRRRIGDGQANPVS